MKTLLSLCLLLVGTAVFGAAQEVGKPAEACERQHAQCMKQCDKEKRAWFFKGEAYDNCAAKCDARMASCAATGGGADARGETERRGNRADATRDTTDSEDQPQAEEVPEADEGGADAAAGQRDGKGKDRAGERGRKDKDRDAAEGDGVEGDERSART